jgi:hypothetical protein
MAKAPAAPTVPLTEETQTALAAASLEGKYGGYAVYNKMPMRVTKVLDGDTVEVRTPVGIQRMRFRGADAPETAKPGQKQERGGVWAREMMEDKLLGKTFLFAPPSPSHEFRDRYGRMLGNLIINEKTSELTADPIKAEEYRKDKGVLPAVKYYLNSTGLQVERNIAGIVHQFAPEGSELERQAELHVELADKDMAALQSINPEEIQEGTFGERAGGLITQIALNPTILGGKILESSPLILSAAAGTAAGGPMLGIALSSLSLSGTNYLDLRAAGASHGQAMAWGNVSAIGEAVIEQVSINRMRKLIKGQKLFLAKRLPKSLQGPVIGFLATYIENAGVGATEETLQNIVNNMAAYGAGVGEGSVFKGGLQAFIEGGMLEGAMGAGAAGIGKAAGMPSTHQQAVAAIADGAISQAEGKSVLEGTLQAHQIIEESNASRANKEAAHKAVNEFVDAYLSEEFVPRVGEDALNEDIVDMGAAEAGASFTMTDEQSGETYFGPAVQTPAQGAESITDPESINMGDTEAETRQSDSERIDGHGTRAAQEAAEAQLPGRKAAETLGLLAALTPQQRRMWDHIEITDKGEVMIAGKDLEDMSDTEVQKIYDIMGFDRIVDKNLPQREAMDKVAGRFDEERGIKIQMAVESAVGIEEETNPGDAELIANGEERIASKGKVTRQKPSKFGQMSLDHQRRIAHVLTQKLRIVVPEHYFEARERAFVDDRNNVHFNGKVYETKGRSYTREMLENMDEQQFLGAVLEHNIPWSQVRAEIREKARLRIGDAESNFVAEYTPEELDARVRERATRMIMARESQIRSKGLDIWDDYDYQEKYLNEADAKNKEEINEAERADYKDETRERNDSQYHGDYWSPYFKQNMADAEKMGRTEDDSRPATVEGLIKKLKLTEEQAKAEIAQLAKLEKAFIARGMSEKMATIAARGLRKKIFSLNGDFTAEDFGMKKFYGSEWDMAWKFETRYMLDNIAKYYLGKEYSMKWNKFASDHGIAKRHTKGLESDFNRQLQEEFKDAGLYWQDEEKYPELMIGDLTTPRTHNQPRMATRLEGKKLEMAQAEAKRLADRKVKIAEDLLQREEMLLKGSTTYTAESIHAEHEVSAIITKQASISDIPVGKKPMFSKQMTEKEQKARNKAFSNRKSLTTDFGIAEAKRQIEKLKSEGVITTPEQEKQFMEAFGKRFLSLRKHKPKIFFQDSLGKEFTLWRSVRKSKKSKSRKLVFSKRRVARVVGQPTRIEGLPAAPNTSFAGGAAYAATVSRLTQQRLDNMANEALVDMLEQDKLKRVPSKRLFKKAASGEMFVSGTSIHMDELTKRAMIDQTTGEVMFPEGGETLADIRKEVERKAEEARKGAESEDLGVENTQKEKDTKPKPEKEEVAVRVAEFAANEAATKELTPEEFKNFQTKVRQLLREHGIHGTADWLDGALALLHKFWGEERLARQIAQWNNQELQKDLKGIFGQRHYDPMSTKHFFDGYSVKEAVLGMILGIDIQQHTKYTSFLENLNVEKRRIVQFAERMNEATEGPLAKLKDINNRIIEQGRDTARFAQSAGLFDTDATIEFYISHIWSFDKKFDKSRRPFTQDPTQTHLRRFNEGGIVEGWAEGFELRETDIATLVQNSQNALAMAAASRNMINQGLEMGVFKEGVVAPVGYEALDHPGFYFKDPEATAESTKQPKRLYAPKKIAKTLNNSFGRSILEGNWFFDTLTKWNGILKRILLVASLFHARAFVQSAVVGSPKMLKNPANIYRLGDKAIKARAHEIQMGVYHGLTLPENLDYDPAHLREATAWGKMMSQNAKTDATWRAMKNGFEMFEKGLFGFGRRLKAGSFLMNMDYYKQKYREKLESGEMTLDQLYAEVSARVNSDFGGRDYQREGFNPTGLHAARLALLGYDWTLSNLETVYRAVKGRTDTETQIYRGLWTNLALHWAVTWSLGNIFAAGLDEEKEFLDILKDAYDYGGLKVLDVDVTPVYRMLGSNDPRRKYLNILGHFKDPMKWLSQNPLLSAYHKGGIFTKPLVELFKGTNYRGETFTGTKRLFATGKRTEYDKENDGGFVTPDQWISFLLTQAAIQVKINLIFF